MIVGVSWSTTRWVLGHCRSYKQLQRLCWTSGIEPIEDFPRARIFPGDEDVADLEDAQSVEEILSTVGQDPRRNYQGLASLLDVQKMFFRVLPKFHQEKEDFFTKQAYTSKLKEDPRFVQLVERVIESAGDFEDEPVAVAFLSLYKMHFDSRGREVSTLYEDLKRRGWLSRAALSRTLVVMRGSFPQFAAARWNSNLHEHVQTMRDDLEVRLSTTALLAAPCPNNATKREFLETLGSLDLKEFSALTLAKALLTCADLRRDNETNGVAKEIAAALRPKVADLAVIDLLGLLRLFKSPGPLQPMCVIDAVKERFWDFLDAEGGEPRAELLGAVFPFLPQRDKNHVIEISRRFLDLDFASLRSHMTGMAMLCRRTGAESLQSKFFLRLARDVEEIQPRLLLRLTADFVSARASCPEFEVAAAKRLRALVPDFFAPSEISKVAAFLALQNAPEVSDLLARVLPQLSAGELSHVARALRTEHARSGVLNEKIWAALQARALGGDVNSADAFSTARLHVVLGIAEGAEPLVARLTARSFDSNAALGALDIASAADVFSVTLVGAVSALVDSAEREVHPHVFTRLASLAFAQGAESLEPKTLKIMAEQIARNVDFYDGRELLSGVLGLAYFGTVEPLLIRHIFSLPFLDALDAQTKHTKRWRIVRRVLCELNRAICIEFPEAHVPWFHQEFCETNAALEMNRHNHHQTYLHSDVSGALNDLFGIDNVAPRVYSPYFHSIDFLVEFDGSGRAIAPRIDKRRQTFGDGGERVAVCVLPRDAYTKGGNSLRGRFKLRRRHLEILGFKVVHVEAKKWDAMDSNKTRNNSFLQHSVTPAKMKFNVQTNNSI